MLTLLITLPLAIKLLWYPIVFKERQNISCTTRTQVHNLLIITLLILFQDQCLRLFSENLVSVRGNFLFISFDVFFNIFLFLIYWILYSEVHITMPSALKTIQLVWRFLHFKLHRTRYHVIKCSLFKIVQVFKSVSKFESHNWSFLFI